MYSGRDRRPDQPVYNAVCRLNSKLLKESKEGISGAFVYNLLQALRSNRDDEEILFEGLLHMCKMLDEFYMCRVIEHQLKGPIVLKEK